MLTAAFRDHARASEALDWLHSRGYTAQEVNVLMSDATRRNLRDQEAPPLEPGTQAVEGIAAGGAIGAAVGATLAAIAAIGSTIAVPGLGLVLSGPLMAALAGGGAGAFTGGVVGGLVGFGIPESNARAYETTLREGGVIIGVRPRSRDDAREIERRFEDLLGEHIVYI